MRLQGKTALITGAARGIGAAVARRFAQDGMQVAVLDLDEAACAGTVEAITSAGGEALAVGANVADVMTERFESCSADDTLERAATLMHEHEVSRLPVTSGGKLVGLVARGDILRAVMG